MYPLLAGISGLIICFTFSSCAATRPTLAVSEQAGAARVADREYDPRSGDWKFVADENSP
jgi:hypothetical protein